MRKLIFTLIFMLAVPGLSGCAPAKHVNSPEMQRGHAAGAQEELSSEVHK